MWEWGSREWGSVIVCEWGNGAVGVWGDIRSCRVVRVGECGSGGMGE